jgi:hypothetical protein
MLAMIAAGSLLRILLWWANPPGNAFDDHIEPIALIMATGSIPAKDACWQCYNPPVYYWISAMIGRGALAAGITGPMLAKLLQFLPCLYGILTLALVDRILARLPLTLFARALAVGTVCFLPRHVYLSAMSSNDTISYLASSLAVYLTARALESRASATKLSLAGAIATVAVFTKYTAYAVVPAIVTMFATAARAFPAARARLARQAIVVLAAPLVVLAIYWTSNYARYGSPLPWNLERLNPAATQPRDGAGLDFLSFTPWDAMAMPIIVPGANHSYWTLVYAGMWFDNEPRFTFALDGSRDWWDRYFKWLRGEQGFPPETPPLSVATRTMGTALILLGLIPLAFVLIGSWVYVTGRWTTGTQAAGIAGPLLAGLAVLLLATAAIAIAIAIRLPVFSAAKAAYFLNALPALAALVALGVQQIARRQIWTWPIGVAFGLLFSVAAAHILHIAGAGRFP